MSITINREFTQGPTMKGNGGFAERIVAIASSPCSREVLKIVDSAVACKRTCSSQVNPQGTELRVC